MEAAAAMAAAMAFGQGRRRDGEGRGEQGRAGEHRERRLHQNLRLGRAPLGAAAQPDRLTSGPTDNPVQQIV
jgi:hypothetical protein